MANKHSTQGFSSILFTIKFNQISSQSESLMFHFYFWVSCESCKVFETKKMKKVNHFTHKRWILQCINFIVVRRGKKPMIPPTLIVLTSSSAACVKGKRRWQGGDCSVEKEDDKGVKESDNLGQGSWSESKEEEDRFWKQMWKRRRGKAEENGGSLDLVTRGSFWVVHDANIEDHQPWSFFGHKKIRRKKRPAVIGSFQMTVEENKIKEYGTKFVYFFLNLSHRSSKKVLKIVTSMSRGQILLGVNGITWKEFTFTSF